MLSSIGVSVFEGCKKFPGYYDITIANVGERAFADSGLKGEGSNRILISKDTTYIGVGAFSGCDIAEFVVDEENPNYSSTASTEYENQEIMDMLKGSLFECRLLTITTLEPDPDDPDTLIKTTKTLRYNYALHTVNNNGAEMNWSMYPDPRATRM